MSRSPFPMPPPPFPSGGNAVATPRPGGTTVQGNPSPRRETQERRTLVVGRGISVQGSIQDAERLVVEGTVEASMLNETELFVPVGGVLRGEVEVEDADLAGTIDGTLTVRGNLTVRATGRLIGKTRFRRLQVEDGGQITGHLEMITTDSGTRSALEAPTSHATAALADIKS